MNAYLKTDYLKTDSFGQHFACGICDQDDFDSKSEAAACCSNLIEKITPPQLAKKRPLTKRQSEDMTKPILGIRRPGAKGY